MRLLLDTHLLLWALDRPERIAPRVRTMIADRANTVLFSAASIWEIAIKAGLGRVDFEARPDEVAAAARETGFVELPVGSDAAARVLALPAHHRDPFDRLLVAQAMSEPSRLLTLDAKLLACSELVELAA